MNLDLPSSNYTSPMGTLIQDPALSHNKTALPLHSQPIFRVAWEFLPLPINTHHMSNKSVPTLCMCDYQS